MKIILRSEPALPAHVLDFDTESRPLHWITQDFVGSEITAVGAAWVDAPEYVEARMSIDEASTKNMLAWFHELYDAADIVTGHYIRRHDLPRLNAAMIEFGLPQLGRKLTQDTHGDLVRVAGWSKSQENMAQMLGIDAPKIGMSGSTWRQANRQWTEDGVALAQRRVTGDVIQHMQLRAELLRLGLLRPARYWSP